MSAGKLLVYLVRRDLRVADNPILHHLATSKHGFTHLLPVFVLPPHQIEVSGFLAEGEESPYPPALSRVGKFWRCGPHRAKFLAQCIWDLKTSLESLESGLVLRVGNFAEVVTSIVDSLNGTDNSIGAVWMTEEQSVEEEHDQKAVSHACSANNIDFKLWPDEKYYIDDRDTGLKNPQELPDIFTTYRKTQEPLRDRPRPSLPHPRVASLPPLPPPTWMPPQKSPFVTSSTYEDFESRLLQPLKNILTQPPVYPRNAASAHPFKGGESHAWARVFHLVKHGGMFFYQETRNGLVGLDYSTKLSGYLATGCITARQIHEELLKLENGIEPAYAGSMGFNRGENEGTKAVRFELLWRDYMRLCTMKFGSRLFQLSGFKGEEQCDKDWKTTDEHKADVDQDPSPGKVQQILDRFLEGNTGMGLIDASQRELYHTGYTSNRARQNVANFLSKHLGIDWRYGAEWYESMLIDYDVSSNWANWQYVSGVGNDPRGDARIFNPVKQAFDYDNNGRFVRAWVPEVKHIEKLENVFQVWTTDTEELEKFGLLDDIMVTDPIKKIEFQVDRKPRGSRRPHRWRRGTGRGGRRGGSSTSPENGDGSDGHQNATSPTGSEKQDEGGAPVGSKDHASAAPRGNSARGRGIPWRGNTRGGMAPGGRGASWEFPSPSYIPPQQFVRQHAQPHHGHQPQLHPVPQLHRGPLPHHGPPPPHHSQHHPRPHPYPQPHPHPSFAMAPYPPTSYPIQHSQHLGHRV